MYHVRTDWVDPPTHHVHLSTPLGNPPTHPKGVRNMYTAPIGYRPVSQHASQTTLSFVLGRPHDTRTRPYGGRKAHDLPGSAAQIQPCGA